MGTIRQRGKSWRAEVFSRKFGRVSKTFETLEQAESWANEIDGIYRERKLDPRHGHLMKDAPMSETHIVSSAQRRIKSAGIYFLTKYNKIIYVGMSKDIQARVMKHAMNNVDFDGFFLFACEESRARFLEAFYINKFNPDLNKSMERHHLSEETQTILSATRTAAS